MSSPSLLTIPRRVNSCTLFHVATSSVSPAVSPPPAVSSAPAHLAPAHAAQRKVKARLNASVVQTGDRLTLHISENLSQARKIRVKDSEGLVWKRTVRKPRYQVWTAKTKAGYGTVTVVTRRADGKVFRNKLDYQVTAPAPARPPPCRRSRADRHELAGGRVEPAGGPGGRWPRGSSHLRRPRRRPDPPDQAGRGGARRGMLPVISYKVGGDAAGAAAGKFNAAAEQAAAKLASYGQPTAVTFWHEPYGDLSGEQYAAASQQLLPIFKRGELRVGPILNGWLLDNQLDTFGSFCPDDLFDLWDWFGIDTYESGTMEKPGDEKPADRIPALSSYLQSRGARPADRRR